ncbi:hypothetical protein VNO77_19737 [Canavalia gladiata]|uniref:Uncharacterized protein n=1 Tax=Canavalia gladiata TaxID=3824 RepID=A0AAN9QKQ0_CANGL
MILPKLLWISTPGHDILSIASPPTPTNSYDHRQDTPKTSHIHMSYELLYRKNKWFVAFSSLDSPRQTVLEIDNIPCFANSTLVANRFNKHCQAKSSTFQGTYLLPKRFERAL